LQPLAAAHEDAVHVCPLTLFPAAFAGAPGSIFACPLLRLAAGEVGAERCRQSVGLLLSFRLRFPGRLCPLRHGAFYRTGRARGPERA